MGVSTVTAARREVQNVRYVVASSSLPAHCALPPAGLASCQRQLANALFADQASSLVDIPLGAKLAIFTSVLDSSNGSGSAGERPLWHAGSTREKEHASSGTQAHTFDPPAPYAITAAAAGRTSEPCGGSPTG